MGIYEELGVRPLINAAGTVTRYGGSLMAPEVLEVMRQASQQFCARKMSPPIPSWAAPRPGFMKPMPRARAKAPRISPASST